MIQRLSEDDRYQLASRADAGARSNRPSHLIAIAGLVLVVTLAVALFAWRSDAAAGRRMRSRTSELITLRDRAERLSTLQAQLAGSPAEDRNRPIPDLLSRMGSLATEAGLATVPAPPRTANDAFPDARRINYSYTVRDESIENLIGWVELATQRIPGLHARRVMLKPQPNAWTLDVTFARFERLD